MISTLSILHSLSFRYLPQKAIYSITDIENVEKTLAFKMADNWQQLTWKSSIISIHTSLQQRCLTNTCTSISIYYRSMQSATAPQVHFLAVMYCSCQCRDGLSNTATYHNADAVEYEQSLTSVDIIRRKYWLHFLHDVGGSTGVSCTGAYQWHFLISVYKYMVGKWKVCSLIMIYLQCVMCTVMYTDNLVQSCEVTWNVIAHFILYNL